MIVLIGEKGMYWHGSEDLFKSLSDGDRRERKKEGTLLTDLFFFRRMLSVMWAGWDLQNTILWRQS